MRGSGRGFVLVALLAAVLAVLGCGRRLDPRLQEGYDLIVAGKIDQAVALANSVLTENPKSAQARNLLGLALYRSGDAEGAIVQFKRSLELDPKYPEAHFNLANAYSVLGRTQDAETEYAAAIRHQPKFALAHYNLGVIYAQSNRKEQAITELRRAVEHNPQFVEAYVLLGQVALELQDFETVIQNLTRALELRPSHKELHVLLGNAYMQSGREDALPSAEQEYRAATGIDSTYVDGLYSLGMSLAAQGRDEEAAGWFRKARSLAEGKPEFAALVKQLDDFTKRTGLPTAPVETSGT